MAGQEVPMKEPNDRFVLDAMLGRLALWLRVLGLDVHYESRYPPGRLEHLVSRGRRLVTRHRERARRIPGSLLVEGHVVADQLREMVEFLQLGSCSLTWFSRCLRCNTPLEPLPDHAARDRVPDHVYHQHQGAFSTCPSCRRVFWPGTHRERMIRQLEAWGIDLTGAQDPSPSFHG